MAPDSPRPVGFVYHRESPGVVQVLVKHGYREADIRKLVGEIWLRVFRDIWRG